MLYILGAGSLAREVYWHVQHTGFERIEFLAEFGGKTLKAGQRTLPVHTNWHALEPGSFVVGVGSPSLKKKLVAKALEVGLKPHPTVVHPSVLRADMEDNYGLGGIIMPGVLLTCDIWIGDYVTLNLGVTVGHDAVLEDYVNCAPGVHVSGNVTLKEGADIGTGAVVKENITVGPWTTLGAQACLVKNAEGGVYVGVPARPLSK